MIVYNILIKIYGFFIYLFSFFSNKISLFVDGRKNWENNLKKIIDCRDNYIWIHCASLGEFEQGRPLIEKIKENYPKYKIILTFFSPSGYEIRKNYDKVDIVFYLPLDTKYNAQIFLKIINPKIAIFVKYEFWLNYINELYKNKIPLFVVSSIFRKNQFFFKWYGKWTLNYLRKITIIFVQNQFSYKLLKKYNIKSIILGDTRFDRVLKIKKENHEIEVIKNFKKNKFLIVFGSTWSSDEKLIVNFINSIEDKNIKFIIAPHNINLNNINFILKNINRKCIKYTELIENNNLYGDILIIDTIGILMNIYKYSDLTYIGGGFDKGIHNILEPAVFGNPIVIGPKFSKFQEAVELSQKNGIIIIENKNKFNYIFNSIINKKNDLEKYTEISQFYVNSKKGTTDKILNYIENYLSDM